MNAIVLFSYASLESVDDVGPFLKHVMHSHATDEVIEMGKKQFLEIGTNDPLTYSMHRIGRKLASVMSEDTAAEWKYYIGNKHTTPFVKETIEACVKDGAERIFTVPTTPFYSKTGTKLYEIQVRRTLEHLGVDIPVIPLRNYYQSPEFINIMSERLEEAYHFLPQDAKSNAEVIFTCHSMPGSESSNADFIEQYQSLIDALMDKVSFKAKAFRTYRSGGHDKHNWLQPDILEVMAERIEAGASGFVVSELLSIIANMEVIQEVGFDGVRLAEKHGLPFMQTSYLNDSYELIDFLIQKIKENN